MKRLHLNQIARCRVLCQETALSTHNSRWIDERKLPWIKWLHFNHIESYNQTELKNEQLRYTSLNYQDSYLSVFPPTWKRIFSITYHFEPPLHELAIRLVVVFPNQPDLISPVHLYPRLNRVWANKCRIVSPLTALRNSNQKEEVNAKSENVGVSPRNYPKLWEGLSNFTVVLFVFDWEF